MYRRIVLFGATGDLTARLLMPAFAQLASEGRLPDDLTILGTSTKDLTPEAFRAHITAALAEHAAGVSGEARASIVARLDYRVGDVTDPESVKSLLAAPGRQLVYLALPSVILERALSALAEAGLGAEDAIAVEKPFGSDLASARRLNAIVAQRMPQPTVFRIDHFLTDTLVQRVLALRFMNRLFEPLLNGHHVARVDVSWLESLALEGRAGYYDRAGALKDMLQNHLMVGLHSATRRSAPREG
ncbi:MAG: glucose-6-phosphate dehydrogenase, partial [Myxococcota bacterium]